MSAREIPADPAQRILDGMLERRPRVFNKHHKDAPADAVYIGRGSDYGNPFAIGAPHPFGGQPMGRDDVIAEHREWLLSETALIRRITRELRGRDLVCFCYPKPCHGDVYLEIANGLICECCGTPEFEVAVDELTTLCLYCQPCPYCGLMGTMCDSSRGSRGCDS